MTTLRPALSPATRGRLAQSSLSELLTAALEHRLDGGFVFETVEGHKSALILQRGRVIKATTTPPVELLGQQLLQARFITDTILQGALAEATRSRRALGEVLLEQGALSCEQLAQALSEQLGRRISLLARLPGSTGYAFHVDRDFLMDWLPCDADPLALIWLAQRDTAESSPRQRELLRSLIGRKLRLHPAAVPERLGLAAQEQIVVTSLRARPRASEELQRAGVLDSERLQRLIYVLALTQQLDYGQQPAPLDANLQRASRPPLGSSPSLLPPGGRSSLAPAGARASSALSRPPSRPPAASSTRPSSAARLPGSLVPPGRRSESAASLHPHDPAALEHARERFLAACEHLQRQQFEPAEKLAREACELDPGNAEYLALHAWLRAQLGALAQPAQAEQIVAALDRAVLKERENVTIRFYRGQVLHRLGRDDDAVRDFRFVLRRDPGHVDAARELRLYEMRKREPHKRPSLLAKLFLR